MTLVKMGAFGLALLECACPFLSPPFSVALARASERRWGRGRKHRGRNKFLCDWLVQISNLAWRRGAGPPLGETRREVESRPGGVRRTRQGGCWGLREEVFLALGFFGEGGVPGGELWPPRGRGRGRPAPTAPPPRPSSGRGRGLPERALLREWGVSFVAPCFVESRGRLFEMVTSAGQKLPERNGFHLKTESRWGSKTFSRVLFGGTKLFQREKPWCSRGRGGLEWSPSF